MGQPLEGVILTLDGDEHLTSGHEGVDREKAQARGAVDEDVVDPLTFHLPLEVCRDRFCQARLAGDE